jgi:hypothetical protein
MSLSTWVSVGKMADKLTAWQLSPPSGALSCHPLNVALIESLAITLKAMVANTGYFFPTRTTPTSFGSLRTHPPLPMWFR